MFAVAVGGGGGGFFIYYILLNSLKDFTKYLDSSVIIWLWLLCFRPTKLQGNSASKLLCGQRCGKIGLCENGGSFSYAIFPKDLLTALRRSHGKGLSIVCDPPTKVYLLNRPNIPSGLHHRSL